jgi:hypothetical protein
MRRIGDEVDTIFGFEKEATAEMSGYSEIAVSGWRGGNSA